MIETTTEHTNLSTTLNQPVLRVEHLYKSFGKNQVLIDFSLELNKAETVVVLGKSGSGKSTMVDLLPRLYDVKQGEILIDGINIKNLDLNSLRSLFAVVTQEAILFHGSIAENIQFGSKSTSAEIKEASSTPSSIILKCLVTISNLSSIPLIQACKL